MSNEKESIMMSRSYADKLKKNFSKPEITFYLSNLVADVIKQIKLKPDSKALDVGAGIGYINKSLKKVDINVLNLDINKYSLEYGKKNGWIEKYLIASVYNMPLNNNQFDIIFLVDVIEHLDNPILALQEIGRVLKPDSFLVVHTPNRIYSKILNITWDPTHIRELTYFELKKMLKKTNFTIVYTQTQIPFLSQHYPKFAYQINKIFKEKIFFLMPFIYGPSFYVIARKK